MATEIRASGPLLERERFLEELDGWLGEVDQGRGRLVLVAGEAGIGKTALVRSFAEERAGAARLLWGACDSLRTPRPLGPLLDIAAATGGSLEELVERGGKPHAVFTTLLGELQACRPTIAVFEDLHWADEATLDVLRLLGRRAEATRALVLATYRDDELERDHPLRVAVGELGGAEGVRRLELPPLSADAVAELAAPHAVDPGELYRLTGGNPFFVTEALAASGPSVPPTVRDAVLARASRLSPPAQALLEAVAIVPPRCELWLLEALVREELGHLDEALASGMLRSEDQAIAFRHELGRLALEEAIGPHRRLALHREALGALRDPPSGIPDPARLAHHAEAAGDGDAVLEHGPVAAERAASLGAHREAAAQYGLVLRFAGSMFAEKEAELLEHRSHECFLTDQFDEAIDSLEQAISIYRELGERRREGSALSSRSQVLGKIGRFDEAEQAADEAMAVLEPLGAGRELAWAYSTLSQLRMYAGDADGAVSWGNRALELAEGIGDTEIVVHTLNNIGSLAGWSWPDPDYTAKLERSLDLALGARLDDHAGRAFSNLAEVALCLRQYDLADKYVEDGLNYCSEHGLDLYRGYLLATRAWSELDQGNWGDAADTATLVLRSSHDSTLRRLMALRIIGLLRARRGDPGVWEALDEALALAEGAREELQRIAPVATARAEAAWLEGRPDLIAVETEDALELAMRRRAPWVIGELAYWRWRAGLLEEAPADATEPYSLQIAGEWEQAAQLWVEIGCPYNAAIALAEADESHILERALAELHRLGATAASRIVARSLRDRGARGIPRGPRPATRANPAGLTSRELEVLELVAEGLRNSQIADRLFVSERTVDHHVSAILRKLDVRSRAEASAWAVRFGLAEDR
jgi:ATP/maltotriose-dependent transcriptional regulator MalT